jgi:hypothetical protein
VAGPGNLQVARYCSEGLVPVERLESGIIPELRRYDPYAYEISTLTPRGKMVFIYGQTWHILETN